MYVMNAEKIERYSQKIWFGREKSSALFGLSSSTRNTNQKSSRHLAMVIPPRRRGQGQDRAGIEVVATDETTAASTAIIAAATTLMSLAPHWAVQTRRADATRGRTAVDAGGAAVALPPLLVEGLGLVADHDVGVGPEEIRLAVLGIDLVLLGQRVVGRVEVVLEPSDSALGRLAHPLGHLGEVLEDVQQSGPADLVQHALRLGPGRRRPTDAQEERYFSKILLAHKKSCKEND